MSRADELQVRASEQGGGAQALKVKLWSLGGVWTSLVAKKSRGTCVGTVLAIASGESNEFQDPFSAYVLKK